MATPLGGWNPKIQIKFHLYVDRFNCIISPDKVRIFLDPVEFNRSGLPNKLLWVKFIVKGRVIDIFGDSIESCGNGEIKKSSVSLF